MRHLVARMKAPRPTTSADPLTPCIGVCRIDPLLRLCVGCARTLDEIGRWSRLSDTERRHIMEGCLPQRMPKLAMQRRALGLDNPPEAR